VIISDYLVAFTITTSHHLIELAEMSLYHQLVFILQFN